MAIAIPTIVNTQITNFIDKMLPHTDTTMHTSAAGNHYIDANRFADILRLLTGLIDSGSLAATGGSFTSVTKAGAFTGTNTLIGCRVRFVGNITPALANVTAIVIANNTNTLTFNQGVLTGSPGVGDLFTVEYTSIDDQIAALAQGKNMGDSGSDPYGYGPTAMQAISLLVSRLGGTVPSYLRTEPFTIGSPHAGSNGPYGYGGAILVTELVKLARDTVAAYTKPV